MTLGRTVAVVGGGELHLWSLQHTKSLRHTHRLFSEIPHGAVAVIGKHLIAAHCIPETQSMVLSFVDEEIAQHTCHM